MLVGWVIRSDTVLVEASGLGLDVRVRVGGRDVAPVASHPGPSHPGPSHPGLSHQEHRGADSSLRITALELPTGTIPIDGEWAVPRIGPELLPPDVLPRRQSFWCRLFPRLRGC